MESEAVRDMDRVKNEVLGPAEDLVKSLKKMLKGMRVVEVTEQVKKL